MFEFLMDSISPDGLLLGRNGERNIPLGTTFTGVRLSRVRRTPGEIRAEDLGEVGTVALTLREIHWYQRVIDYVPGGHTAGLFVAGEGLSVLAVLLRELRPCDYLTLTAPAATDAIPGTSPTTDVC